MTARLPNFLIVGAAKSGTTSLASWLRDHPEAFVPQAKELHFFDRRESWERGVDWYAEHFREAGDAVAVGEATPGYMFGAPTVERIAATVPDARHIVCLREPVARAHSHWHHWRYRQALEWRSFARAVADELDGTEERRARPGFAGFDPALGYYLARGHYLEQLEGLARHVPRERLHVVLLDDLESRPDETFAGVCRFLGIDDGVRPATVGGRRNVAAEFRPHYAWRQFVRHKDRLPPRAAAWMATHLFVRREVTPRPVEPSLRASLHAHFAEDNRRLAAWLERDLSGWDYASVTGRTPASSASAASPPSRTL